MKFTELAFYFLLKKNLSYTLSPIPVPSPCASFSSAVRCDLSYIHRILTFFFDIFFSSGSHPISTSIVNSGYIYRTMSNPLVERILSNPLTFISAKQPDREVQSEKPSGYIVLTKKPNPHSNQEQPVMLTRKKHTKSETKRPLSMAEAIAAYTGRKYMSKAEKKKATPKVSIKQVESDSSDDTHYESASEFQTDSSFHGFRSTSEDKESENTSDEDLGTPLAESITVKISNMVKPSESDEEKDDKDYAVNNDDEVEDEEDDDVEDDEHEEDCDDEGDDDEDDEDDEDVKVGDFDDESAADDGEGDNDDDDNASEENDSKMSSEDLLQLKHDLLNEAKKTPPTSPDDDTNPQVAKTVQPPITETIQDHYSLEDDNEGVSSTASARIVKMWNQKQKGLKPVGLLNFGVTCYMNSAIQAMVHIPAVQHYLQDVHSGKHPELKPRSVTHTLADVAAKMWGVESSRSGGRKYVNPKKIVQRLEDINCMMSEWQQEDSHEYFMSLMARMQEDSTPKGRKLNESIIYDIFGGLLDQKVICQTCHTVSRTKQELYDLSLGLNRKKKSDEENVPATRYTIEKSIKEFFDTETIKIDKSDHSSGYHCEKCKKRTVATKKSTLEKSPETLMVHLKRFKFNGNSLSKVKQPIIYLKYLDLGPYTSNHEDPKYQLMSVIVHEGRSILSGHYIAHCLQPDGTWSTYDDEYINKIDERGALSDPSAYCLVYTKLSPKNQKRRLDGESTAKRVKL